MMNSSLTCMTVLIFEHIIEIHIDTSFVHIYLNICLWLNIAHIHFQADLPKCRF